MNRFSERALSQAKLVVDTVKSLNIGERAFMEAEEYGWAIAEVTIPERREPNADERIRKGVKLRFLLPETRLPTSATPLPPVKNLELRGLYNLPTIASITEKEGAVYFRQVGGRMEFRERVLITKGEIVLRDNHFYYSDLLPVRQ